MTRPVSSCKQLPAKHKSAKTLLWRRGALCGYAPKRRGAETLALCLRGRNEHQHQNGLQMSESSVDICRERNRSLLKTALETFVCGGLCLLASDPASAATIETVFPRFEVQFLGISVNHQQLIEALVLGQAFGFVGSTVSGYLARKRKEEVESLNERLLQVTRELRKQTRAQRKKLKRVEYKDDDKDKKKAELLALLKQGKQALSDKNGILARDSFQSALVKLQEASHELDSPWRAKRKAVRGLGAAHEELGEHTVALEYMKEVVHLSESNQDQSGLGDAYGVIADIYTEMGNFEAAAEWYDKYIAQMNEL